MRAFLRQHRWAASVAALALLVIAFLAFRPDKLFVDDVVDETLADAFAVVETTTTTSAPSTTIPPSTTNPTSATSPSAPVETSTTTTTTTTTTVPLAPVATSAGGFYGIGHSATGTATVYEQDGRYVLRFEDDTDIQNGPDLYVWVLPSEDYDRDVIGEHIDLGKLKGNVGGQNYELPAAFDPSVHRSVLIWCERFRVPFAAVPLSDV